MKYTVTDVVVADNPRLSITKACLSRSLAWLEFDNSFVKFIPVAVGFVPSHEPSAEATLVLNLKNGPALSEWSTQIKQNCMIGNVSAYVDGGRSFILSGCAIMSAGPGHDGEATSTIMVKGSVTKEMASAGLSA
jgi:hypothetical protein